MKTNTTRSLIQSLGLLTLSAAPLWAAAQAPGAPTNAPAAAAQAPLSNDEAAYLMGLGFGGQLHQIGITNEIAPEKITQGIKDGLAGKKSTPADQQRVQAYVRTLSDATSARTLAAGQEFLAKNAKEKGVKTTASGLQYKVIEAGDAKAASPTATDQVSVNYRGTFIDGSEFDSSYSRGQPATFPVSGVIKGWQEALVMMKPGAKWKLYVPSDLGYGPTSRPGIPGGSVLIFDVELLSITGSPPPPKSAVPQTPGPGTAK